MPLTVPYMISPGAVPKVLDKIKEVPTPPKVTQEFVKTKLGFPGGTGNALFAFLKRLGFVSPDGAPTEIYKRFRNPEESKHAIADAFRFAYAECYAYNEYFHELDPKKTEGLLIQHGGFEKGAKALELILSTIAKLKALADFEVEALTTPRIVVKELSPSASADERPRAPAPPKSLGMNLSYTINLNLPATNDISVYNAIFKSLKENLLDESE